MTKKFKGMTIGIVFASKLADYQIPILDYDGIKGERDVRRLMKKFRLGKAVQTKTKRGYHYIFPYDNGRTWEEIVKIINASNCDQDWKDFTETGFKCGRVGKKYKKRDLKNTKIIYSKYRGKGKKDLGNMIYNIYKLSIEGLGNWQLKRLCRNHII